MNRIRRKHMAWGGLIVGFVVLGICIFFFYRHFFAISEIVIQGNRNSLQAPHITVEQNIFFVDTKAISAEFEQKNPLIKNVRVEKRLPNKLHIYFEDRLPVVKVDFPGGVVYLDEEGVLLPQISPGTQLPTLRVSSVDIIGEKRVGNSIITTALEINQKLQELGIQVEILEIKEDSSEIWVQTEWGEIRMRNSIDIEFFFSSLQLLLRQFRIEGKQPELIDFRFNKPVIRLKT